MNLDQALKKLMIIYLIYQKMITDFPVFGNSIYFLLNNVSKALILYFIH